MKIVKTLLAGENGTKKLTSKYGERLLCVRYRFDPMGRKRLTTVELIEDTKFLRHAKRKPPRNKIVQITVAYGEARIGKIVREAGGKWNRQARVWELAYGEVVDLGLEERLVKKKTKNG